MQIIPSFISLGLYISPVGFSSNIIPDKWLLLYSLNPMVGVINGFRWAILGGDVNIHISGLVLSIVLTIIIFITDCSISDTPKKRLPTIFDKS